MEMRYGWIVATAALLSCDRKTGLDPAKHLDVISIQGNGEQTEPSITASEISLRRKFEGKTVFTIKCDDNWHASPDCHRMDLFRTSFPIVSLLSKESELLDGDLPFRCRRACPWCIKG